MIKNVVAFSPLPRGENLKGLPLLFSLIRWTSFMNTNNQFPLLSTFVVKLITCVSWSQCAQVSWNFLIKEPAITTKV